MTASDPHDETGRLFAEHRDRLRNMVQVRMDPRLRGRLDASDVVQEAYAEAVRRLPDYRQSPDMPFYLWLRFLTGQKLLQMHRRHVDAKPRRLAQFLQELQTLRMEGIVRDVGLGHEEHPPRLVYNESPGPLGSFPADLRTLVVLAHRVD